MLVIEARLITVAVVEVIAAPSVVEGVTVCATLIGSAGEDRDEERLSECFSWLFSLRL